MKKLADATDQAAKMTDERLINDFGASPLDDKILERWERVTGKRPHPFMRRGLYFCHRELEQILNYKEQGKQIYIYTGRGPSSDTLHVGHMTSFIINKYIQEALDCWFIIQITDDEKFMRDANLTWEKIQEYTEGNIRDIIAHGYDPEKTFIMRESKWYDICQPFLAELSRNMTLHTVRSIFGFTEEHSVGYVVFPVRQIAPAFAQYFPGVFSNPKDTVCLIPCARDQDPYFRFARELAGRMKLKRVSTIYGRFIPSLHGDEKMTASKEGTSIYLSDTPEMISDKIINYAKTAEGQNGSNLKEDAVFKYLEAFLEDDDLLEDIRHRYGTDELREGEKRMEASEVKEILIKVLIDLVTEHQRRKSLITPEIVEKFEQLKKAPLPDKHK